MQDIFHAPHEILDLGDTTPTTPRRPQTSRSGHIRLRQLLGSGRHGLVFLGVLDASETSTEVAVKVPNEPGGLDAEGTALHRFAHPGVVQLLDGPLSNGALVLELCAFGTLADRLLDGNLPVADAKTLVDALVPAVRHLHEHGWIHGDISPANIGLRSQTNPALLDFATARPADGQAVSEGTAEFAGPLRQADPRLDIRALAATMLAAIGTPDRWDHPKRVVLDRLEALVQRCDNDEPVTLDEIIDILHNQNPAAAPAGLSGGGPFVTQPTRAFGPSPTATATAQTHTPSPYRRARALLPLGLAVSAVVAAVLVGARGSSMDPAPLRLAEERTAEETLSGADAVWDDRTGVVTITLNATARTLAAGEPGDRAAIGDWNCDGTATLGVFRPSTGAWFVFDSWADHSVSRATHLGIGTTVVVTKDAQGCATPNVGSISEPDR